MNLAWPVGDVGALAVTGLCRGDSVRVHEINAANKSKSKWTANDRTVNKPAWKKMTDNCVSCPPE